MLLYLDSLKNTIFAQEPWTFPETSKELVLQTEPQHTFKKQGYTVTVLYDNNRNNVNFYTNWHRIYYLDNNDEWQVTDGKVDHEGLYYVDASGFKRYFQLFQPDAERYGVTGQWTVQFGNTTISSVVTSTTPARDTVSQEQRPATPASRYPASLAETPRPGEGPSSTTYTPPGGGRRQRQGKQPATRRSFRGGGTGSGVAPEEVGSRSTTLPRSGLGRLGRLTEEARDPAVIILKGPANTLKCWRHRCMKKHGQLLLNVSSVWRWVERPASVQSRMLVAFNSLEQRKQFLMTVKLPRTCTYDTGFLNSL